MSHQRDMGPKVPVGSPNPSHLPAGLPPSTHGEGPSGPVVPESSLHSLEASGCVLGLLSLPQFPHLYREGTLGPPQL